MCIHSLCGYNSPGLNRAMNHPLVGYRYLAQNFDLSMDSDFKTLLDRQAPNRLRCGIGARNCIERSLPEECRVKEMIEQCLAIQKREYALNWHENTRSYDGFDQLLKKLQQLGVHRRRYCFWGIVRWTWLLQAQPVCIPQVHCGGSDQNGNC